MRHQSFLRHFLLLTLVLACPTLIQDRIALAADLELKRQLEHEDYDSWNTLASETLSNDGKWVSFIISKAEGESTLKIQELASGKEYSILRGRGARFSYDSRLAIYNVEPDPEVIKKLRKERKPESEFPKEKLEILHLESGNRTVISQAGRFSTPEKSAKWLAFSLVESEDPAPFKKDSSGLSETYEITPEGIQRPEKPKLMRAPKNEPTNTEKSDKKQVKNSEKKTSSAKSNNKAEPESSAEPDNSSEKKKEKKSGSTLVLRNLETYMEQRFPYVTNHRFNEDGSALAFTTSGPKPEDDGVHIITLKDMKVRKIATGLGTYGQVVFSKNGQHIAFLSDKKDYQAKTPKWGVYLWKAGSREALLVADNETAGIPQDWIISSGSAPQFTEDGKRLLFQTRPKPEEESTEKDNAEKDPVAKLDLWHWQDPFLQPQQLLQASRERERTFQALYDINANKVLQLATKEIPDLRVDPEKTIDFALGGTSEKYNKMRSWDTQGFSDWYLVNLKTGKPTLIAEMTRGSASLSPSGKYITWWDGEKRTWLALPTSQLKAAKADEDNKTLEPIDLAKGIGQPLFDELHDTPSLPGPYGSAGWTDKDATFLIYDRWDMWEVDPSGEKSPICVTDSVGRKEQIQFRRLRLDAEEKTVDLATPQYFSALVHQTKASGFYKWQKESETVQLNPLLILDENVSDLRKARESDAVIFTRSTFQRCPDLWSSDLQFKTTRRLSRINPQQDNFLWGTAELVRWQSRTGQPLEGILYKPEDFDPNKKYPMLVYFYERYSDNLHRYYRPEAGRSIINFSFYVSRGYVVFIPDIPYLVGEPGPSAANAILPGVEHILSQGFVDPKRVGMQGHSWGGYQTAYLVTVTDMFACAESGAPVSNMTSAYGGIRWGSGMSRMFQYEKTQSRIGQTLWEARDKYIANSPLFAADKIKTPLLILHNDEDDAVPWYQGIELFVALRRLEKPAWMLNYNGDLHGIGKKENRIDFAKRMQQFFDHYLKGDPMPVWMAEGIPAVSKGKEFGFEYVKPSLNSDIP